MMNNNVMRNIIILSLFILNSCLPSESGPLNFNNKKIPQTENQRPIKVILSNQEANFQTVTKFIFKDKCLSCHNSNYAEAGVILDNYGELFKTSEYDFPVVTPNEPESSGVYDQTVSGLMPEDAPLTEEEVDFIKRWIEEGAPQF